MLLQFACQSALILAPVGGLRMGFRAATYLSSIAFLVLVPAGGRPYPLRGLVAAVVAITALGLLHPQLNSLAAGLGQVGMTLAIWGPVFWVGRVRMTPAVFLRVLLLAWAFNTLSAAVGVLQVYDPDRFAPDPKFTRQLLGDAAEGLMLTLDDGRRVYRPMGLSDTPGGAAAAGSFAILSGLGLLWQFRNPLLRCAILPAAAVGAFCIYLCQVRVVLIVTAISLVGIVGVMAIRGRVGRAVVLFGVAAAVVVGGFVWAVAVGNQAVTSRLTSLIEEAPAKTYYSNRGHYLEYTLTTALPEYPLGAGLGRWGMMSVYFGDPTNFNSPKLFAEIQPTAWVLDGGLPLLLAGYVAAAGAFVLAVRLALRTRSQAVADMAMVVAAFGLGVLALTFGYAVFVSQTGMMFWVLNAALFAVGGRVPPAAPRPAGTPRGRQ
jgi:hypothetical protein